MTRFAPLIAAVAIVLMGMASGLLSGSGYGDPWFDALAKPAFMPPAWAFPVVWTTLYALMGVAAGLVFLAPRTGARNRALGLFAIQLALNLAWSPLFFGAHLAVAALWLMIVLDLMVGATILAFLAVRRTAGVLLLPYAAWLLLATALNWEIVRLNP